MPAKVIPETCIGCQTCVGVCPVQAISMNTESKAVVDAKKCTECWSCVEACPVDAIIKEGGGAESAPKTTPEETSDKSAGSGCAGCPGCG